MLLSPGTNLGRYKIRALLGEGGMGQVYLAEDTRLGRRVALKFLPVELTDNSERLRRFEQEARTASALNHPNILTIYEIGVDAGAHFIATEFIDGETLRAHIQRAHLSLEEILDIAMQTAAALSVAHEAGIVHRDIKPENIMLRRDGLVKVLDFGLAKLTAATLKRQADVDSQAPTRAQVKTNPGVIMGTIAYMSPEQARGQETDARTDIFSLGVVLYEVLAGHRPFAGETQSDVMAAILKSEPPPLQNFNSEIPAELERIISKTLAKDCEERYQTAKDLLVDLRRWKKQLERTASSNKPAATQSENAQNDNATQILTAPPTSSTSFIAREIRKHKLGFAVALSVLLLAAIGLRYWLSNSRSPSGSSALAPIESIAVLPFVNESGNTDVEYLSDGMTESLIISLSQLPHLLVKARSSVFRYKGRAVEAQQVATELSVQAILNGRVVLRADDLTLYLSLVDARSGNQLWGEQYNRKLRDLVSLQSEIARDVSQKLRARLSGADEQKLAKNYTANPEAYQLYLKGNYEWNKHMQEDLQKAIEYYNQAIALDPNYALAYFGLSASYGVLGNNYLPPKEAFPKAKDYAAKALAIDDTLAESHASMGAVELYYDWNWAEAEKELKRAQTLNPNFAGAHHLYGDYLESMGRFDEAKAERKRALELEPLSPLYNWVAGATSYYAGQDDEAMAQLEKTVNLEPRYPPTYILLGQAYEQKQMYAQAIATYQKGITQAERDPQLIAALGHAYALSGERDKALKTLDELREMSKQRYISPYLFAVVYVGLDDKNQAFAWLDKAYQDRAFFLIWLKVEPLFDPLRADPRFQDLLRRIGLTA